MNYLTDLFAQLTGSTLSTFWSVWGPSIGVFFGSTLTCYFIVRRLTRQPKREEVRLREIRGEGLEDDDGDGSFGPLTETLARGCPSRRKNSGLPIAVAPGRSLQPDGENSIYAARFVLLIVPLIVAGWAVVAEADETWRILFFGGMTAACLSVVPRLYVFFRRRRRMQRIRRGLPDTIDMLSMCTSGGLGMSESLEHVAGQIVAFPELAQELLILKRQAEVSSLKQALADFTQRVDLPEVRQLVGLLTRGARLGTQLAGSLNEQADHLRVARRQAATAQANKTPVKLVFPILFCFAPAALILLTAPAILELRDFIVPTKQATRGEVFGTGQIVEAIQPGSERNRRGSAARRTRWRRDRRFPTIPPQRCPGRVRGVAFWV